jgi:flagellar assembly factor FliW
MEFLVKLPIKGFEVVEKVKIEEIDDTFSTLVLFKGNSKNDVKMTLVNPYKLTADYSFEIPIASKTLLEINENSKLKVFLAVVLQKPIEKSIVNFRAPFIFNTTSQKMAQIIFSPKEEPNYSINSKLEDFLNIEDIKII